MTERCQSMLMLSTSQHLCELPRHDFGDHSADGLHWAGTPIPPLERIATALERIADGNARADAARAREFERMADLQERLEKKVTPGDQGDLKPTKIGDVS